MIDQRERTETLLDLYRHMVTTREMDLLEQDFTGRGEAFFHVSAAGHEGSAMLAPYLIPEDYLHVHYRDKALMLARGVQPEVFFHALFNKDSSHSRGRQMNAHMSAPELNILSLVGPVGNSGLQAAGVAEVIKDNPERPIVLCGLGDGMTQQGEILEAIGHAVREELPVFFLIQDNAFAISTKTAGQTFYWRPDGKAEEFYGMPIHWIDGRKPLEAYEAFGRIVGEMREQRGPAIAVMEVDRLHNHTNADDQRLYRSEEEIRSVQETGDPIVNMQHELAARGHDPEELTKIASEIRAELKTTAKKVQRSPEPEPVFTAHPPLPEHLTRPDAEYLGTPDTEERYTMLTALRETLRARMEQDERVTLFGEDIEDPKGDVFGVTRGLTKQFPGRVRNSPLAEASILGISIGRALAGGRPVGFLQFADFLPIAYNQVISELGSMWWRTDGGWTAPVILMITCGGYKPGLGPFHASSLEAIAAHVPGVDVVMPSTAYDAAGMLNAAFESERPTLFFYPKSCLNDRSASTSPDVARQLVLPGRARIARRGADITLVGYGNTMGHCAKTAAALEEVGIEPEVIDARWIAPWDVDTIRRSAERTGKLVIVHEDNRSCGFGAEVAAEIAEQTPGKVRVRRVTRPDTYVPCNFSNQLEVLPGYRTTLEAAVELLGGTVEWEKPPEAAEGEYLVEAIGSSPSDESVTVVEWRVAPGDTVASGDVLADLEADKAAIELRSPVDGTVSETLEEEGNMVKVGAPILRVRLSTADNGEEAPIKPVTREEPGTPHIRFPAGTARASAAAAGTARGAEPSRPVADAAGGNAAAGGGTDPGTASETTPATPPGTPQASPQGGGGTSEGPGDGHASAARAADAAAGTRPRPRPHPQPASRYAAGSVPVHLAGVRVAAGSRIVDNQEISRMCPDWSPDDIVRRTGIERRPWLAEDETPVDLGERASRGLLEAFSIDPGELDAIICATETPILNTPATSTLIHHRLARGRDDALAQAHDVNAACTGYLYALQSAYDYIQSRPKARILVVTAEALSRHLDTSDPDTAPIFGDAATATLIAGAESGVPGICRVLRPALAAKGEDGSLLRVPSGTDDKIHMDGPKVFLEAVRGMMKSLREACGEVGIEPEELDMVVPHQANQRIINAVRQRLKLSPERAYSNIRYWGNTSSSTIPICLHDLFADRTTPEEIIRPKEGDGSSDSSIDRNARIGLVAFGGGFTFGGAVLIPTDNAT